MKSIEDKTGNLHLHRVGTQRLPQGRVALRRDGEILGRRMHTDADHGAFFADAQPSKFKIGLMPPRSPPMTSRSRT